ncbi:zinc-finger domain-containing protein [Coralloluteibacterium thermophilus]|uniref:Zinc-finger domain-containing protein n=1 Tax=Coralloluteibacterium thermophilum TaxID=2707049 RepID=A0ABV9NGH9_9GAMM
MTETSSPQPATPRPGGVQANAERRYEITRADLPLSCPLPEMSLWNSHPRVYLPIEAEGGEVLCPYCGATYVLKQ